MSNIHVLITLPPHPHPNVHNGMCGMRNDPCRLLSADAAVLVLVNIPKVITFDRS